jgi:hypothetical protein
MRFQAVSVSAGSLNTVRRDKSTGGLLILKFFVFFPKPFDPAGGIDQLLFACKKRMTFRANFNADVLLGRADLDHIAAGAFDGRIVVFRVDIVFHFNFNPLQI